MLHLAPFQLLLLLLLLSLSLLLSLLMLVLFSLSLSSVNFLSVFFQLSTLNLVNQSRSRAMFHSYVMWLAPTKTKVKPPSLLMYFLKLERSLRAKFSKQIDRQIENGLYLLDSFVSLFSTFFITSFPGLS